MQGAGLGQGGVAPEDESQETGFRPEKVRTALRAGKMLLEIQEQGEGLPTEVSGSFASGLEDVRQGVSEAILHERIPPDYHEAIQRYFDTLPKDGLPKDGLPKDGVPKDGVPKEKADPTKSADDSKREKSGNDRP